LEPFGARVVSVVASHVCDHFEKISHGGILPPVWRLA
jgi:hypothetical protein